VGEWVLKNKQLIKHHNDKEHFPVLLFVYSLHLWFEKGRYNNHLRFFRKGLYMLGLFFSYSIHEKYPAEYPSALLLFVLLLL